MKITTVTCFFEVEDGQHWANAWKKGTPGNRREALFVGIAAVRTSGDPENHRSKGSNFEAKDMEKFQAFMASDEARQAAVEDGMKLHRVRVLAEFTP